jgi:hypothetical protein
MIRYYLVTLLTEDEELPAEWHKALNINLRVLSLDFCGWSLVYHNSAFAETHFSTSFPNHMITRTYFMTSILNSMAIYFFFSRSSSKSLVTRALFIISFPDPSAKFKELKLKYITLFPLKIMRISF